LIQLASVGNFLGALRFFNGSKLHKRIVSFHIDSNEFAKGFKEHLQVFSLGGLFVEVDDKEGFRRSNVATAIVFFAFDAAVSASEFCS
jgi:hypothetical protein